MKRVIPIEGSEPGSKLEPVQTEPNFADMLCDAIIEWLKTEGARFLLPGETSGTFLVKIGVVNGLTELHGVAVDIQEPAKQAIRLIPIT